MGNVFTVMALYLRLVTTNSLMCFLCHVIEALNNLGLLLLVP